jgi:hypothetical protein
MHTIYDWVTVAVFAGLVTRFLAQSVSDRRPDDSIWHYLPPAAGCAAANWLGNRGLDLPAIAVLVMILAYIYFVFFRPRRRNL